MQTQKQTNSLTRQVMEAGGTLYEIARASAAANRWLSENAGIASERVATQTIIPATGTKTASH